MPEQSTYRGSNTAKSQLYELWSDGDDRSDEELAEYFSVSGVTVRNYRSDWNTVRLLSDEIVAITNTDIPLETRKGIVWCIPHLRNTSCCKCDLETECKRMLMAGGYIACEMVLRKELFVTDVTDEIEETNEVTHECNEMIDFYAIKQDISGWKLGWSGIDVARITIHYCPWCGEELDAVRCNEE